MLPRNGDIPVKGFTSGTSRCQSASVNGLNGLGVADGRFQTRRESLCLYIRDPVLSTCLTFRVSLIPRFTSFALPSLSAKLALTILHSRRLEVIGNVLAAFVGHSHYSIHPRCASCFKQLCESVWRS